MTSGTKASATRVSDAWAMPGFPTRTDGDAILGWARITEREGGTEGNGDGREASGAVVKTGEGRDFAGVGLAGDILSRSSVFHGGR